MQSDRAIEHLIFHQSDITKILIEAKHPLGSGDASEMKAMALARWELTRTLRRYQLFKHIEIFDPLIRSQCPLRADAAAKLKQRCIDIGQAYAEHVQRWSLQGSASSWEAYQKDATKFIDRIERHLESELCEVRLLLAGINRTRRRYKKTSPEPPSPTTPSA